MDDLSLCKRIAEIDDVVVIEGDHVHQGKIFNSWQVSERHGIILNHEYNPLTDDALCFQLIVKYDIDLMSPYRVNGETKWEAQIFSKNYADAFSIYDESPNKAILLAIIEAHKESNESTR